MKLKKTVLFNLKGYKKLLLIYYGIFLACLTVGLIILNLNGNQDGKVSGLEMTSAVFLFVVGVSSFRSDLYLFLQNGISRKTTFVSYCISSLCMTGFMAFVETILYRLIGRFDTFQTQFSQIYCGLEFDNVIIGFLTMFGWCFFMYFAMSIIGYFVAGLYYRMGKYLKIIVSVGVPFTILFILPILNRYVFNGRLVRFAGKLGNLMFGTYNNNYYPVNWMISSTIVAIIFGFFGYLLTRRAIVKSR